jgi:PAS domain S-box-containing protein
MEKGSELHGGGNFRLLRLFAAYLLDQKRDAFLRFSSDKLFELDVPLLRQIPRAEGEALADKSNIEMLQSLAEGHPGAHIQKAIDRWRTEQFPRVQRNHFVVEDVTRIGHARKVSFLKFLPEFTNDNRELVELMMEVEDYILEYTSTTLHNFVDIIDNRMIEQLDRLQESEALYKNAERIANIGNWRWEVNANTVHWTDGLYRIYGFEPGSIAVNFEVFLSYVHEAEREKIKNVIVDSLTSRKPFEFYHRIVTDAGIIKTLHSRGEVMMNDKGDVYQMIGSAQDVTTLKEAERQLREHQEILEHKTRELQESNASLEEFAFVASHDLKEPLRKISILISMLGESVVWETEKQRVWYERILASAARMRNLIEDLLSLSMISANTQKSRHNLGEVFNKALSVFDTVVQEMRATIISDELPEADIIPSQFDQLFQNLLSNALKFTRSGVAPEIKITHRILTPEGSAAEYSLPRAPHLEICVADNGVGFNNVYSEKIFAVFQRLHHKDLYEGTGIGLAICRKVVKNHGGIMVAKGQEGKGAEFLVIIPL